MCQSLDLFAKSGLKMSFLRQQELEATIPLILHMRPLIFSYISSITGETAMATLGTLGFFKLSQDLLEGFS